MIGIFTRVGCPARGSGVAVGGTAVAVGGAIVAVGGGATAVGEAAEGERVVDAVGVGVAGRAVGVSGMLVAGILVVGVAGAIVAVGTPVGVTEPPHETRNRARDSSNAAMLEPAAIEPACGEHRQTDFLLRYAISQGGSPPDRV
jgi:hypothetical protein